MKNKAFVKVAGLYKSKSYKSCKAACRRPDRGRGLLFIPLFLLLISFSGCRSWDQNTGYNYKAMPQIRFKEDLSLGKSTVSDVQFLFGPPTFVDFSWGSRNLYYVSTRIVRKPLRINLLTSYQITELSFDDAGMLTDIKFNNQPLLLPPADQPFYREEHIEVGTNRYGIIQQMINNIGRFNK